MAFNGSFSHFVELFFKECELSGDIFFRNGPNIADNDSKTKHQSLQMYRDIRDDKMAMNPLDARLSMADLQQRPPYGCLEAWVPTFTTNSSVYNLARRRFLLPAEMLDVIGVPQDAPVAKLLHAGKLSDNVLRKLLGNTMAIPCVGTALLYVLCCCRSRTPSTFLKASSSREF